jgi:hypothetical protein
VKKMILHFSLLSPLRSGSGLPALIRAVVITAVIAGATSSRLPAQGLDTWSKVESAAETRDYSQQLKEGKFEAAQRTFLSTTILPQLALPANRMMIGQVRQRIREVATLGAAQSQIFEASNSLIRDFGVRLARDGAADPLVRVNAMMLVGELQAADRKPWKGAVEPLALAAGDATLPLEVRIVALTGLARHAAGGDGSFTAQAGPALTAIVTSPPQGDAAAVSWLIGRALDLLPTVGPPPAAIAAVARIASAENADLDLRVRAAAAFAKVAIREGGADPAAMVGAIRSVAVAGLRRDLAAAEARRFSRQVAAGGSGVGAGFGAPVRGPRERAGREGMFGGLAGESGEVAPLDEDGVPALACRRNAWRLVTLADALKPEAGTGGIAALLDGDAAAEALELASTLRRQAREILAHPVEETIKQAVEALQKALLQEPAKAGVPPASGAVEAGSDPSPFDEPAAR